MTRTTPSSGPAGNAGLRPGSLLEQSDEATKRRMEPDGSAALPAGAVLTVTATDPAAPEDLPAWCRLTGHALLTADHPTYRIRRRGD